jgi:hypothetical protein
MPKYIGQSSGQFETGGIYNILCQDFTGKIYNPGRVEVNGKLEWKDKEGLPDERVAVFAAHGFSYYQVYQTADDVLKDWAFEANLPDSDRLCKAIAKQLAT